MRGFCSMIATDDGAFSVLRRDSDLVHFRAIGHAEDAVNWAEGRHACRLVPSLIGPFLFFLVCQNCHGESFARVQELVWLSQSIVFVAIEEIKPDKKALDSDAGIPVSGFCHETQITNGLFAYHQSAYTAVA